MIQVTKHVAATGDTVCAVTGMSCATESSLAAQKGHPPANLSETRAT
jgi:hypothetical protein